MAEVRVGKLRPRMAAAVGDLLVDNCNEVAKVVGAARTVGFKQ
jgi:hypothetical protein